MKKIYLLLILQSFIFHCPSSFGQAGKWTWISGSNHVNAAGVYGTQGVPSVNNHPPGEYEPSEWKDKQGNFWIYGGTVPDHCDLWKYNPFTNEWTWVKGDGGADENPVYGTQGVADPANSPGSRTYCAATWVDTSGALWLFGGSPLFGFQNDLWKYDISTNEWTWMNGDDYIDGDGIYGNLGVPDPSNTPGARDETCSAWTDNSNNLWLFGGYGSDEYGDIGCLSDLWEYDISTNEWTWMKGSANANSPADYGSMGTPALTNDPGARMSYGKWKDAQGNFWTMGGWTTNYDNFSDLWKYDPGVNEWTWMNGAKGVNDEGAYNTTCSWTAGDLPYSRSEQRSSVTDNCGRFWLFGGFNGNNNYNLGCVNDLWVFDPQQLQWNWVNGTTVPQGGNYGTVGVASSSNAPPSRCGAVAWWGNDNKFYMFGGIDTSNVYSDVWVFTPDTNCIPVCASATVPPPDVDFQSSDSVICSYNCIQFTDRSTNATSWQWSFAGGTPQTSTEENPQSICYLTPGIYNVTLIASNTGGSDSVTFSNYISVKSSPPTPVITQHHDTLYCSTDTSYTGYQWYSDSSIISGATDTFLVVSKSGNYNLQVTNSGGCKIAVGINVIIGIQNYSNNNTLSLYPNPATDELIISGNWKTTAGKLRLSVFNVLGEIIYTEELNGKQVRKTPDSFGETVNCKTFSSGIYFVQVATESGLWVGRFVKE